MPLTKPTLLSPDGVIVFEGDSLTRRDMPPSTDDWPLLRMNNWHRSYAELADEWLFALRPDLRIKCRHSAIGGSSIEELHQRYETQTKPHRPAWIVFTLGTNDGARQIPLATFERELSRYLATAARDAGTRCLYVGGFQPMPGLDSENVANLIRNQPYYESASRLVREAGGLAPEIGQSLLIKAEQHYATSTFHTYYADGLHFNALGNHVIAGLVLEALGVF